MLRSILVGLDASASGDAAVELGLQWAKRAGALLMGLGVREEVAFSGRRLAPVGSSRHEMESAPWLITDAQHAVDGLLVEFIRRCVAAGVRYRVVQAVGAPPARIVEKSRLCDLILLGQQPRFHFADSCWPDETLAEVLRRTSRPVVAVPEAPRRGKCVLIAYDGSPPADRALQAIQTLRLAADDEVHVLTVDADRSHAKRLAGQAVDFLRMHEIDASLLPVPTSTPAHRVLLAHLEQLQPRLLVMGAFGRSTWREFIFGSTTSRLLETSPVPLFLCR